MGGDVYFIEGAGRIKVGFSVHAEKRIRSLSTASSHPLKLIGTMPGSYDLEKAIHKKFSDYRVQGEWFTDCSWTREVIAALLKDGPSVIGYRSLPSKKGRRKEKNVNAEKCDFLFQIENPYKDSLNRVYAAIDEVVNERVASARKRENQLQLELGTLVNPLIGGYYTPDRWVTAGKMVYHILALVDGVTGLLVDSVVEGNEVPERVINDRFDDLARALRKSLKTLFSNPDLAVIDLGAFEWVEPSVIARGPSLQLAERAAA